jgi:hypothetical protein
MYVSDGDVCSLKMSRKGAVSAKVQKAQCLQLMKNPRVDVAFDDVIFLMI